MPAYNVPQDEYLSRLLASLQQQVAATQSQQQYVVVDQNLALRLQIGLLENGDYGILLADPATATRTELLPLYTSYVDTQLSTSSATPVALAGSPAVTATIGASGDCIITVGSSISNGAVNNTGFINLEVDGAGGHSILSLGSTASITAANVQSTRQYTKWTLESGGIPLTPGQHTFGLHYSSSTGGTTVTFSANWLSVQPI
jgi:hypothetical protein